MLEIGLSDISVTDPGRMYLILSEDSVCGLVGPATEAGNLIRLGEAHRVLENSGGTVRIEHTVPPGQRSYGVAIGIVASTASGGGVLRMWYTRQ